MPNNNLPTYAIIELLIRLEKYNDKISGYKGHAAYDDQVIVTTTDGSITLPESLVTRQFESPTLINDNELAAAANLYKSLK